MAPRFINNSSMKKSKVKRKNLISSGDALTPRGENQLATPYTSHRLILPRNISRDGVLSPLFSGVGVQA
jgi:hypothetical protein